MPYKHCQLSFIHFYYLLLFLLSMQYTQLLLVPCPLAFVLCIMHTVYSFFAVGLCCVFVFVCALFCVMYTRYDEQRGRGGLFCVQCARGGGGGIWSAGEVEVPHLHPQGNFQLPRPFDPIDNPSTIWHNTITPISSFRVG